MKKILFFVVSIVLFSTPSFASECAISASNFSKMNDEVVMRLADQCQKEVADSDADRRLKTEDHSSFYMVMLKIGRSCILDGFLGTEGRNQLLLMINGKEIATTNETGVNANLTWTQVIQSLRTALKLCD